MGASHPEKNRTFGGLLCCALYKSMAADIHLNLLINLFISNNKKDTAEDEVEKSGHQ